MARDESQNGVSLDRNATLPVAFVFHHAWPKERLLAAHRLYDLAFVAIASRLLGWHGFWLTFDQANVILFISYRHASKHAMAILRRLQSQCLCNLGYNGMLRPNGYLDRIRA